MNEEEKEAIDKLKSVINNDTGVISDDIQDDEIETILNLIDKQQKEINEMEEKIKKKIRYNKAFNDDIHIYTKLTLEELLEELLGE